MKNYSLKFLLISVLSFSAVFVQANNSNLYAQAAGIEVTGEGSVTVTPDSFSLSVTISERGRITSKLKALVDKKSNAVIQAAKKLGIKNNSISSAQVNLRVIEEKPSITLHGMALKENFPRNKKGSVYIDGQDMAHQIEQNNQVKPKKALFELSRKIAVNFSNIDEYDLFLTALVKINVSHISSLSMRIMQREQHYQQALLLAITQAKKKAQQMAQHSGSRLGKLMYLKEQSNTYYQPRFAQAIMSESSTENHSSLVGSQTIKGSVLMKFSVVE